MTKLGTSILMLTLFFLLASGSLLSAEEIVLCLNSTDQYVVKVNEVADCLEDEKDMRMRSSSFGELKNLTPVAIFKDNENCDTKGTVTKLGFDKNGNNALDEDEIAFMNEVCANPVDEESDE